jgi:transposase
MYLLPPDMRDWLPGNHLVWFIMEIVSQLDLTAFYQHYNPKGEGRAAYHPSIMTALYFYSYCTGIRSSRKIEQLCIESVPFRIISGDQQPDHTTISRFRNKFAKELANLFIQVLTLCYESGLCNVKTVSVDGTKIKADASMASSRTESGLKKEIEKYFKEADREDAREDELYGPDKRGDELPPELSNREDRLRRLREAQERLRKEREQKTREHQTKLEERKAQEATCKKKRGRKPRSTEQIEKEVSEKLKANITDPDSRIMKTSKGYLQGFNAQAVASEDQIILNAELTSECNDKNQLIPMIEATRKNLGTVDANIEIGTFLGDAGYFSRKNLDSLKPDDPDLLVAVSKEWKTRKAQRDGKIIPLPLTPVSTMEYNLLTSEGRKLYKKRSATIEPVFGHIKEILDFDRFMRRGLEACACEWKMICIAYNLLKLWRYGIVKVRKKITENMAIVPSEKQVTYALAI